MKMQNATWLLRTIMEQGPITLKEINALWMKNGMSGGNALPRTSFNRYKNEAEDFYGLEIVCDKNYRYYVENTRILSDERIEGWIYSRMSDDLLLMDSDAIRERVMLESTPSARLFLKAIIGYMKQNRVITLEYRKYGAVESQVVRVKPYFLKLYHQKWYLVTKNMDDEYRTYSLDRMVDVTETDETFTMEPAITAAAYFKDSYGVVVDERMAVSRVVLRAYGTEADYLRDLPLHHSQKELLTTADYTDFEYRVRPSLELMGKVLERGGRLEVRAPDSFREQILRNLESTVKLYKTE